MLVPPSMATYHMENVVFPKYFFSTIFHFWGNPANQLEILIELWWTGVPAVLAVYLRKILTEFVLRNIATSKMLVPP